MEHQWVSDFFMSAGLIVLAIMWLVRKHHRRWGNGGLIFGVLLFCLGAPGLFYLVAGIAIAALLGKLREQRDKCEGR